MKAIMISDKAKWCVLMMNGKKIVEVRTSKALATAIQKLIDENGYADIYVYCSKIQRKHYHLIEVVDTDTDKTEYEIDYYIGSGDYLDYCYEGKVAFKFRCYKVEAIDVRLGHPKIYVGACIDDLWCLDNGYHDKNYMVNAIHISDLEIFDKPKEISEFYKIGYLEEEYAIESHISDIEGCDGGVNEDYIDNLYEELDKQYQLTKAPQNFCYVEVKQYV